MFDWLSSKAGVAVAAIVILGVMLGLFMFKFSVLETESLDGQAEALARQLNDITSKDAEFKMRFTFDRDENGYEMPAVVNGNSYEIQISNYQVVLTQGDLRGIATLLEPVHGFYPPAGSTLELDNVYRADLLVENFTVRSGEDFWVESRAYMMPGTQHLVFCYSEGSHNSTALEALAARIDSFTTFDLTNSSLWEARENITLDMDIRLAKNVLTTRGNLVAFTGIEHLWEPGDEAISTKEAMNTTDLDHASLSITAGNRLVLQRKHIVFQDSLLPDGTPAEAVEIFAYDGGHA